MKNSQQWRPTKYVLHKGKLRSSRIPQDVTPASRLVADLVAKLYDEALRAHCRGDLLDLGCGRAPLYLIYRDLATSVTCVDWGSSPHDVGHADVLCDLNEPIPLADDMFDTVILSDVLEHLYRPHLLLAEVARMLRPGGKLIMNVPFMYWLHEQPHDYYRYTRFTLERMLKEAGFDVLLLKEVGGGPESWADLTSKLISRVPLVGQALSSTTQWSCRQFINTRFGRRVSEATAPKFPLGYFVVAQAPQYATTSDSPHDELSASPS